MQTYTNCPSTCLACEVEQQIQAKTGHKPDSRVVAQESGATGCWHHEVRGENARACSFVLRYRKRGF